MIPNRSLVQFHVHMHTCKNETSSLLFSPQYHGFWRRPCTAEIQDRLLILGDVKLQFDLPHAAEVFTKLCCSPLPDISLNDGVLAEFLHGTYVWVVLQGGWEHSSFLASLCCWSLVLHSWEIRFNTHAIWTMPYCHCPESLDPLFLPWGYPLPLPNHLLSVFVTQRHLEFQSYLI